MIIQDIRLPSLVSAWVSAKFGAPNHQFGTPQVAFIHVYHGQIWKELPGMHVNSFIYTYSTDCMHLACHSHSVFQVSNICFASQALWCTLSSTKDIIPLTKDGRECVNGMMSITTGTVIPTPKEARMRQMISPLDPDFGGGMVVLAVWLLKNILIKVISCWSTNIM